ncbi:L-2-hydroxyglutarate oxidase [Virgibacillus sp. W0430]|uniref:L-2-hydroxyglutarate oxidase n=1 Tax=Virgibacillus sp. W0430 TaxID=3391580 RepID=UPI003F47CA1E
MKTFDYLIVGGGIIGLSIARELINRFAHASICLLEKEAHVAYHSSGRNSGVLHAGFYYTSNSLKARFTKEGNKQMTAYCVENNLPLNRCGKLVVATNEEELQGLFELKKRAETNHVEIDLLSERDVKKIDPNANTYRWALYSPTTASVDPVAVCNTLKNEIINQGVQILCNTKYKHRTETGVLTNHGKLRASYVINAAGLYADHIAKDYHFGEKYTIIPFKGIYLKYDKNKSDVTTNIYPVPNLNNPFLGVHFTKTVDGSIKIGPTATPAFWRENYKGMKNFCLQEFLTILFYESRLFRKNSFNFRSLAKEEMKKYKKSYFVNLALKMVDEVDKKGFGNFMRPGIRAQLLNKDTMELAQDFVVEGDHRSFHVLNAVSPGFTCAFPFSKYVVDQIMEKQKKTLTNIHESIS